MLVTAHDAFRYFGKAYGIEVRGIQGVSTDSEAGVKQINELVDYLVQRKIKAIFVETSVSEQNVRSLLEGCKAQKHDVVIGGELFSDAMGEDGTPEGTYEGMIRHNVTTIVKALQLISTSLNARQVWTYGFDSRHSRRHGRLPPQARSLGR